MDRQIATGTRLMPESVAAIPAVGEIGVVEVAPASAARVNAPSPKLAAVVMVLIVALTVCSSLWVYFEGSQILRSNRQVKDRAPDAAGAGETVSLARVARWQLVMTLVMAGGGVILVMIMTKGVRTRQQIWAQQLAQSEETWKAQVERLRLQIAGHCQIEEDLRRREGQQQEELQGKIAELSRLNATLNEDLERRRQAEKSLDQQRQELARSKDVLELHVRARSQELEKFQRRSELILNSAAEGICGFDLEGKVTFVNPAAARVMGLGVEEMVGRPEGDLFPGFRPPAGADTVKANGFHPIEAVATRPDGTTFAAEYIRSPICEETRVVGEVLMFKDITERKQNEEALAQRAAELARSNAELEQFAFVASHDLQEPLRKIQAFGDRLKTKCEEAKLEAGRDYLERMQAAAARMQTLINDLLTFSRVISRSEPFAPVNLTTVTREVLGDLEVSIEKSHAKVEVGELPTVDADAMQIRQLMQNLIGNALKFQTPGAAPVVKVQGRIVVQASARGSTVFFARKQAEGGEVAVGEGFCELTVTDNGIGFDERYLEKIFAVFTRLHGRQEYDGTGIGLAVCRRIVDRHGGSITARSKPGEGATFIVHLPVHQSLKPNQLS
jgi:PAS domain S-box-containing protein